MDRWSENSQAAACHGQLANGPSRRAVVASGVAALLWPALADAEAAGIGHVTELRGEASAELASTRRALALNAKVMLGDLLTTGAASRLAVDLGPKTHIRLGEGCRLRIDKYIAGIGGDFTLEAGVMKFESTLKLQQPDLQFRSAYGLIAVRGTRFYMGKVGETFGVLVGSGAVAVTAAGDTVVLRAGEGCDIAKPGERPSPSKTWGYPRVRQMLRLIT